jgi:hypothetical protein
MATLQEKLADSLSVLKAWQDDHKDNMVIQGASRIHFRYDNLRDGCRNYVCQRTSELALPIV